MNPRPGHRARGWGRVAMAQVVAMLWPLRGTQLVAGGKHHVPRADRRLIGQNGDTAGVRFDGKGFDRRVEAGAARQRDP